MRKTKDYRSFMEDMDPDLKELFAEETGLVKRKTKKKAKKKARFKIGDEVETKDNKTFGTIIFGPYTDAFDTEVYEIETEENGIITVNVDNIIEYVPPVEEKEDDDDLL